MTKPKVRVSRQNKGGPTLAEQRAALEKLRELVRQIEAEAPIETLVPSKRRVASTRRRSRPPRMEQSSTIA